MEIVLLVLLIVVGDVWLHMTMPQIAFAFVLIVLANFIGAMEGYVRRDTWDKYLR